MDSRLQRILDFLNRAKVRATYGAVGEAMGKVPGRAVGEMLGERRTYGSWVVNSETREPTGYEPKDIHPDLHRVARVIESGEDLLRCMTGLDPHLPYEVVENPTAELLWSDWTPWEVVHADARSGEGAEIPNGQPGVYEVKRADQEKRLTIGNASDLRMRVKQGLVRGKSPHSAGEAIREKEDLRKLVIRWAVTERPAMVEEELHRRHEERFGRLPEYVHHT